MNQPYDPNNPYGGSYAPQGSYGQLPSPQPPKSKLPMLIAVGLVLVLAIGVTLYLVLRDDDSVAARSGHNPDGPSAVEVTAQFFAAVDAVDEQKMNAFARGELEDDVADIVDQGGTDEVTFADGEPVDDAAKQVDGVVVAIVVWELTDLPPDVYDAELAVGLLDDGEGFKICRIDDPGSGSAESMVDTWATEFEEHCDYS